MVSTALDDRRATADEVRRHAPVIRELVREFGMSDPRLRSDGTVVVHSPEAGYRSIHRLSAAATQVVGVHVQVISDDAVDPDAIPAM